MTVPDRPRRPAPMPVTVLEASRLSPTMVRVTFGGADLQRFRPSVFSDSYVKLTFPCPGVQYPEPLDISQIHAGFPQSQWPVVRTYTVRSWDAARCALTIDFVVHGDSGIAGPWAAAARPGDRIFLQGPGGAYAPDERAGWHLLVGDESALPAIAVAIERLAPNARGHVLIEVPGPASEIALETPAGVALSWLHKGPQCGEQLVKAVRMLDIPDVAVHAFVHGEAGFVAELRRMLRVDLKWPRDRLSMSGYWRLGANEEGWRAAKASWNAAAEEIERRAGVA
ncbi:MAG: siderophore-interacting protein [Nakamurella sp.]